MDLKKCDKTCLECIKQYKKKFLEDFKSQGKDLKFLTKCQGIPKEYITEDLLSQFSDLEYREVLSLLDPVIWAEENLDWYCLDPDGEVWKRKNPQEYLEWRENNPGVEILGKSRYHRPYQAAILRCNAARKILRIGRQAGKCLASGSLVQMADGTLKPVEDVRNGDKIVSYNDNYEVVITEAYKACNGIKHTARIELMDGRWLGATYNHPFLVRTRIGRETSGKRRALFKDEWKPLEEIRSGDYIAVPNRIVTDESSEEDMNLMSLLGLMLSDGNMKSGNLRFSNQNVEILSKLEAVLRKYDSGIKQYDLNAKYDYNIISQGVGKASKLRLLLESYGIYDLGSRDKFIPDVVMNASLNSVAEFLRCYFGCDGWASILKSGRYEIGVATVSEKMAQQLVSLLSRFGIYIDIRHKFTNLNGKKFHSRQLVIAQRDAVIAFCDKIGILGKMEAVQKVKCRALGKNFSYKTDAYRDNDIYFIKVKSIDDTGKKMTWDLTVPETHNFVANNIISHNTEAIVVSMLYHMVIRPGLPIGEGFKIVLIAPYQSHVDLIFTRIRELLFGSSVLKNSIFRSVKAPQYMIELNNGSRVTGFSCVAGTKIITDTSVKNIEDVQVGDKVVSLSTEDNILFHLPVSYVFAPNFKDVYEVTLSSLHKVTVSEDHPFYTKIGKKRSKRKQEYGWKKLKNLKIGDEIAIANDYKYSENVKNDPLSFLLGLILGDGNITERTLSDGGPRFTNSNLSIQRMFEKTLKKLNIGWRYDYHKVTGSKEYTIYKREDTGGRPQDREYTKFTSLLYKYGLVGLEAPEKFIPDELLYSNQSARYYLLYGLLLTDGWLQRDGAIGFGVTSERLTRQVSYLLNSFGIKNSMRIKKQAGKKTLLKSPKGKQRYIHSKHDIYELYILSKAYQKKTLELFDLSCKEYYKECFASANNLVYSKETDISFYRIKSIEHKGKQTTYDIQVGDGENNFIANGIILHNTAGTKSGSGAASARGQHAHFLAFDESDMLDSSDLDAAFSIITNHPDCKIWMSSTPTGKRERFYHTCHNPRWKEFHYPSMVNPIWNDELETTLRESLTSLGWIHEAEASFGEMEQGVFQHMYIKNAQQGYKYGDLTPTNDSWEYAIGVDWNDTANGTTIAVIGRNKSSQKYYIVDTAIVQREGWTQTKACEEIVRLNRFWRPFIVYIDQGHGGTQWEMLRGYGFNAVKDHGPNHPDAGLRYVKALNFSSNIETRCPFTKKKMKKPVKGFLVENAVRFFENGIIYYPGSDNDLTRQLQGYIIDRIGESGRPIYKPGEAGDHMLDAVMICLAAYALERSAIGKPRVNFNIDFTSIIDPSNAIPENIPVSQQIQEPLIKKDDKPQSTRPSMDRTGEVGQQNLTYNSRLPASHTSRSQDKGVGLWAWPGFLRDEPPPSSSLLNNKKNAIIRRGLGRDHKKRRII